jgi:uncharacterized membrane protein
MIRHLVAKIAARRNTDERGAILVMAVAGVAVMTIAASLSVDIGRLAVERRENQSIADLVALDVIQNLGDAQNVKTQSATRNGAGGRNVVATVTGNSVKVTVDSVVKWAFQVGQKNVHGEAVASIRDLAGFSMGSSLATLSSPTALNSMFGGMIGGSVGLSLVSWQGIANTNMTLTALQTQLVALGLGVGTFDQLMTTDITLVNLYKATANVLTSQGKVAEASALNTLSLTANSALHVKLGDLMNISSGDPGSAMTMAFNIFQFVTGNAEIANGSNAIAISNLGVTIPNVLSTSASLTVIEPPVFYFGPAGYKVSTAQVQLSVTPKLNLSFNVGLVPGYTVQSDLPAVVTAAGADGTLKTVTCSGTKSMTVTVDPKAVSGTIANNLTVKLLGLDILTVPVSGNVSIADAAPSDKTFTQTAAGPPPVFSPTTDHYGATTLNLGGVTLTPGSPVVLGFLGLGNTAGAIVGVLMPKLPPVMSAVDTMISPVLQALGVDVGSADTTPLAIKCGWFGLTK